MLVFCEDCGERNSIDLDTVKSAGNIYRCQACNFLNPLITKAASLVKTKEKKNVQIGEESILKIITEINREKGIQGSYLFHQAKGIIASDVFADLSEAEMLKIGQALTFCLTMSHKILQKTTETYLILTDKVMLAKEICRGKTLVVCCITYPLNSRVSTLLDRVTLELQRT